MHEDVVKKILTAAPQKIVYISCNPSTQARDILLLSEKFNVNSVQPVDMFPQTHHVENIILLENKEKVNSLHPVAGQNKLMYL
jgi:23S rRNA (uracil1939-C5)-methyltransferase